MRDQIEGRVRDPLGPTYPDRAQRQLLRFGSMITLSHPRLRRLLWPARSGYVAKGNRYPHNVHIVMLSSDLPWTWKHNEKYLPKNLEVDSEVSIPQVDVSSARTYKALQDTLLNSTQLRKIPWNELWRTKRSEVALEKTATTSEVPDDEALYRRPSANGYLRGDALTDGRIQGQQVTTVHQQLQSTKHDDVGQDVSA